MSPCLDTGKRRILGESMAELIANYWWVALIIVALIAMNYKRIGSSFGGDIIEITPQEAAELIEQKQAVVIDIAEKRAFDRRHIPEATSLPGIMFIDGTIDVTDFPEPVILVPMKGLIPMPVVHHLQQHGAPKIYKLKGGTEAWRDAGYPVACS